MFTMFSVSILYAPILMIRNSYVDNFILYCTNFPHHLFNDDLYCNKYVPL